MRDSNAASTSHRYRLIEEMRDTRPTGPDEPCAQPSENLPEDERAELKEYLVKLIQLVPNLSREFSSSTNEPIFKLLLKGQDELRHERAPGLTDLHILQSALDYIMDLQELVKD